MYKLFTDKSELFECDIKLEGARLSKSSARLVVETSDYSLLFKGNISASGKITGLTGSFGRLEGLSPITIGSPVVFSGSVTMSNQISSSGNILGSTGSFNSMILSNLPTSSVNLPTGSVWVSGSTVISGVNCGTLMITL